MIAVSKINYVVNNQEQKMLVQINIEDWENIINTFEKMENMITLKTKLQNGFQQIKEIQNKNKKGKTFNNFLNEL